jgi:hypothetical protein
VALHRAKCVQRTSRLEELAIVIDGMDLGGVREYALLAIGDDRVRLPRVPELPHHLNELVGHLVSSVMVEMLVQAEVLRGTGTRRGHQIAAHPAVGQVIERRDQPGQQERRIERGRHGRYDAQTRGGLRQQRNERHRVVLGSSERVLEVEVGRPAVVIRDERRVLE